MSNPERRTAAIPCAGVSPFGSLRVGARLLQKRIPPDQTQTKPGSLIPVTRQENMNHSINYDGDRMLPSILSDLGVDFALSPFHRVGFHVDETGIQTLSERFHERVFRARQWFHDEKLTWTTLLLRFDGNAFLIAYGNGSNWAEIIAPRAEQVRELHAEVRKVLQDVERSKQPAFFMLRYDCTEIEADPIENLPEAVTDDFLRLCYGEDILAWVAEFAEKTGARAGGLTIFDGPPGTGKTSLISEMIRRLEKTHVFYSLPVSQDRVLSAPELVPFWQKQNTRHGDRVKVIVMEDAERLLWRRNGDNREAVSSLLNIADGLMGRMLRLHIICSVNAKMEDLDPAVLRPGRLMNHRRFDPLSRETAARLATDRGLAFAPNEWSEGYTLAEVLNPGASEPFAEKPPIGFQN
jgi:hypothetical protein